MLYISTFFSTALRLTRRISYINIYLWRFKTEGNLQRTWNPTACRATRLRVHVLIMLSLFCIWTEKKNYIQLAPLDYTHYKYSGALNFSNKLQYLSEHCTFVSLCVIKPRHCDYHKHIKDSRQILTVRWIFLFLSLVILVLNYTTVY